MSAILAIDPGVGGGMAIRDADGQVEAIAMPDGMTAQIDTLQTVAVANPGLKAVIENVGGYRPGNSGPSSVKFARHVGNLEAALYCLGIPFERVAPATWMKALGTMPKDKAERKNFIKESVARRFPHLKVTLKTADALGILVWATKESK